MHVFMASALAGDEWSASRPGRFNPGKIVPGTRLIGWMDPRARLDDLEKGNFLFWDSNFDPSVVQPVASRYTD
jgi:hypothetical protein